MLDLDPHALAGWEAGLFTHPENYLVVRLHCDDGFYCVCGAEKYLLPLKQQTRRWPGLLFVGCSVAFAASLKHGVGLWRDHVPAGDPVVIVRDDGDVAAAVIDAEHDLLSGQEACLFEQRIGDLHPRKGGMFAVFLRAVCGRPFLKCTSWRDFRCVLNRPTLAE
ncbi:hypothetical protein [Paraburkholderia sp. SIMBA_030]|uniref:hypothetical protein n=1 Tax=Paraburkholderia sp. SIMBA_030 TaxID=3085773 RepID=UPI00397E0D3F